jgi:hypothetical protein
MNKRILIASISGCTLSVISIFVSWALVYDTSPFYQDSLRPGWTRWIWEVINIPAFLGTMVSQTLATGIIVMLVQWFLIGFFIAWLVYGKHERQ